MRFPAATFAVLLCASAAFAQEPATDYKVGDKVDILFGGVWYPGAILKVGEKTWFVHYDNYADSWDSWVPAEKLRHRAGGADPAPAPKPEEKPPAEPGPVAPGDPVVGEKCEGSWNNSWYEVDILKVEGGKYFVHWRGYGAESDEWLTRDRLRRKGEEKEVLPRKGREGDGGGLPPEQMVGKNVEVFWHGKWWPAKVVKTDGKRFFIHYLSGTGTMEEWAVRERVREVGGAVKVQIDPAKVPGRKGLSGLFWRQMGAPGQYYYQHFLFFPDGRLYFGLPDNPDDFDFEGHRKTNPSQCGGYGIENGQLFVELGGDADEWAPSTFEKVSDDRIKINGQSALRAKPMPEGLRLEGRYVSMSSGSMAEMDPGGVVTADSDAYVFRKDGTYDYVETLFIGVQKDAHGERTNVVTGKYHFSGNHLVNDSPPDHQVVVAYPLGPDDAPYDILRIGDQIVRLRKK